MAFRGMTREDLIKSVLPDAKTGSYSGMKGTVAIAVHRNTNNYDTIVGITGFKGVGKSNLAIDLAMSYSKVMNQEFDIEQQVVYSADPDEIFTKVDNIQQQGALVFDEAARIILAEDWNNKNSKRLKKMWAEIRTKNLLIILVLPFRFNDIDSKYRHSLIDLWIEAPMRNFGLLMQKTRVGFMENSIYNILGSISYTDSIIPERREKVERIVLSKMYRIPSFMWQIKWPEIPKKYRDRYYELRDKAVFEDRQKEQEEDRRYKEIEEQFKMKLLRSSWVINTFKEFLIKEYGFNLNQLNKITGIDLSSFMQTMPALPEYEIISTKSNKLRYGESYYLKNK